MKKEKEAEGEELIAHPGKATRNWLQVNPISLEPIT